MGFAEPVKAYLTRLVPHCIGRRIPQIVFVPLNASTQT